MKRRTAVLALPVACLLLGSAGPAQANEPSQPTRVLHDGPAWAAGLLPRYLDQAVAAAAAGVETQPSTGHPYYSGEVMLAARHGVVARTAAAGWALRYADSTPTELPRDQWIPMREDTIFDLASISKLFTSIAALQQVEKGRLDIDTPVAHYIPAFGQAGKDQITVKQLLTHTSGLPAWLPLYTLPTNADRMARIYSTAPVSPPGTAYLYSDLNMITLGELVSQLAGAPLDVVVREGITEPLGMRDTGYHPPAALKPRIAATEYRPGQGVTWGTVHDENAASFGGVAGHAGVFSTARDMAVLCQTILNGGGYGFARILSRHSVDLMLTNENTAFPGNDHGLGFELNQIWYMAAMSTPRSAGHTGFTGTNLVIDPTTDSFLILLTNAVHPSRSWGSINPARRAVADDVARAVPVRPVAGPTAWYGGMVDQHTATLTMPLPEAARGGRLGCALWYDTEPGYDLVSAETSSDGGTTWTLLPFTLTGADGRSTVDTDGTVSGFSGRRWGSARADLPAGTGPLLVRWRYTTDELFHGRGVYLDRLRVWSRGRPVFDDDRPSDAAQLRLDGFAASAD